jgi:hypothetical protein
MCGLRVRERENIRVRVHVHEACAAVAARLVELLPLLLVDPTRVIPLLRRISDDDGGGLLATRELPPRFGVTPCRKVPVP